MILAVHMLMLFCIDLVPIVHDSVGKLKWTSQNLIDSALAGQHLNNQQ